MHSQSARDVYYRFTLHYKKENLVAERNPGDFFITFVPGIPELSPDSTMKILIDNGHGLNTSGKRSPDGKFLEAIYNREIVRRVVADLRDRGYDAALLVPEEEDIPLKEKVRRVNAACSATPSCPVLPTSCPTRSGISPDPTGHPNVILISIHVNAAGNGTQWMRTSLWITIQTWTSFRAKPANKQS